MTRDIRRTVDRCEALYNPARDTWGDGPWQSEPDILEWRHSDYPGLPLLIVRNPHGALCGYVGLPPGHPLHGKGTGDLEERLDVHGGVTYAAECGGHVCHVPGPGEPEHVWWIGFDCAHVGDMMPAMKALLATLPGSFHRDLGGTYRTLEYVMAEVEELAEQVKT